MNETTIYDIAMKSGYSTATVSRVINNNPKVSEKARQKIQAILEEMKYVPNSYARSLVTQNSRLIGILIGDMRKTYHAEGVFYIEREFSQKGYNCLICNTSSDAEKQAQFIQVLSQRKLDGVILMGSVFQNSKVKKAINSYLPSIPVVMCNGFLNGDNIYGVLADERRGIMDCVRILYEKGKRNFAFITDSLSPSNKEKIAGFEEGCECCPGIVRFSVIQTQSSADKVCETVMNLRKECPDVDAMFFSEDYLAIIGSRQLLDMGVSIPDSVAVVGINNSKYLRFTTPPLSSLDNFFHDISMLSARIMLQILAGEKVTKKLVLCCSFIERSST